MSLRAPVTLEGCALSEKARGAIALIVARELAAEDERELIEARTAMGRLVALVELQKRVAELEAGLRQQNEAELRRSR